MQPLLVGDKTPYHIKTLVDYYMWLCEQIKVNQPDRSYWLLAKTLYEKKFIWSVPNDDNRVFEAKELFDKFCDENDVLSDFGYPFDEVSMLELVVALAYRCATIMLDQNTNISINEWFWKLLVNVRLDRYTDETYYYLDGPAEIDKILDKIIDRTYKRDGRGGLFPLKKAKNDQRKVELWYQMCSYLIENYYVVDVN